MATSPDISQWSRAVAEDEGQPRAAAPGQTASRRGMLRRPVPYQEHTRTEDVLTYTNRIGEASAPASTGHTWHTEFGVIQDTPPHQHPATRGGSLSVRVPACCGDPTCRDDSHHNTIHDMTSACEHFSFHLVPRSPPSFALEPGSRGPMYVCIRGRDQVFIFSGSASYWTARLKVPAISTGRRLPIGPGCRPQI